MKTTILTTLLVITTIFLSGCAGSYSFIDNRYENKTQVNMPLKQALQNVKYSQLQNEQRGVFKNNDTEIRDIIDSQRTKTCSLIHNDSTFSAVKQQSLKNEELEPLVDTRYDYNVSLGQFARIKFCHNKREEARGDNFSLDSKLAEKINENCDLRFEDQRDEDVWEAKQNGEFMKLGYVNLKSNIYVPNVNPLTPEKFFDYKVFNDNLSGTLIVELEYKDHKNRSNKIFLYEDLVTCEFVTRSKKEIIKENEEKIKSQQESLKKNGRIY